ncbi:conserved domain protein [Paenibacillus sp. HGF5]|nr:conserved domain protein [Paenibacillus sp. HGF5]
MLRQREARIRQKAYNNEAMLKRQSYPVKGSRISWYLHNSISYKRDEREQ